MVIISNLRLSTSKSQNPNSKSESTPKLQIKYDSIRSQLNTKLPKTNQSN